jgi:hypothetical protein
MLVWLVLVHSKLPFLDAAAMCRKLGRLRVLHVPSRPKVTSEQDDRRLNSSKLGSDVAPAHPRQQRPLSGVTTPAIGADGKVTFREMKQAVLQAVHCDDDDFIPAL